MISLCRAYATTMFLVGVSTLCQGQDPSVISGCWVSLDPKPKCNQIAPTQPPTPGYECDRVEWEPNLGGWHCENSWEQQYPISSWTKWVFAFCETGSKLYGPLETPQICYQRRQCSKRETVVIGDYVGYRCIADIDDDWEIMEGYNNYTVVGNCEGDCYGY